MKRIGAPLFLLVSGCAVGPQDLPRLRQERDRLQAQVWQIEKQYGFSLSSNGLEAGERDLLERAKGADSLGRKLDGRESSLNERERALSRREAELDGRQKAVDEGEKTWLTAMSPQERLQYIEHLDNLEMQKAALRQRSEEGLKERQNTLELQQRQIEAEKQAHRRRIWTGVP